LAGRVGGGKFTILLSNCSLPQARLYVERLMRDFEAIKIKSSDGKWLNSSISVGVVHILPNEDFNSAWKRASKKLLLAKSKGSAQLSFS
ncbi:diguanylate cyclase domain-containing protein, partial [Oleiphilus sp. HI0043]